MAKKTQLSSLFFSFSVPKTIKSSSDYISDLFKINVTLRPTKKDVSTSTLEKTSMKRLEISLLSFRLFNSCLIVNFVVAV